MSVHRSAWQATISSHGQRSYLQQFRVHHIPETGWHSQANHARLCALVQWADRKTFRNHQALAMATGLSKHRGSVKCPSGCRLVLQPCAPAPEPEGLDTQGGLGWAGAKRSLTRRTRHAVRANPGWCALRLLDQALKCLPPSALNCSQVCA